MDVVQPNKEEKPPIQVIESLPDNISKKSFRETILEKTEGNLDVLKDKSIRREEDWMVYLLVIPLVILSIAASLNGV